MSSENQKWHPLRCLRARFADSGVRDLRKLATQRGFAEYVGRSESLIRNIEAGLIDCSSKLATAIAAKTGVSSEWLSEGTLDGNRIPSEDGGDWAPEMVLQRGHPLNRANISGVLMTEADRRGVTPANLMLHMTRALLVQSAEEGNERFPEALAKLLRDFRMFGSDIMDDRCYPARETLNRELPRKNVNEELSQIVIPGIRAAELG